MVSSTICVDVMVSPLRSVAKIGVRALVEFWRGPWTCVICWWSKKWRVAPKSNTIDGTWFCCDKMWVASANFVGDDGSGVRGGSGVGKSPPLPEFHFRFGYLRGCIVSLLPPL